MKKPGLYTAEITLPVNTPLEFELLSLKYPLLARNDAEASAEIESLRKKLACVYKNIKVSLLKEQL